jgi:hypothetical protein
MYWILWKKRWRWIVWWNREINVRGARQNLENWGPRKINWKTAIIGHTYLNYGRKRENRHKGCIRFGGENIIIRRTFTALLGRKLSIRLKGGEIRIGSKIIVGLNNSITKLNIRIVRQLKWWAS